MGRYYKHDGKKLPSVTTITGQLDKPALVHWAANCAVDYIVENYSDMSTSDAMALFESARKNFRKVSKKALDIGSEVHDAIEHFLTTGEYRKSMTLQAGNAFDAFMGWLDTYKDWETLATEQTVYADTWAGTLDWNVKLDGKHYVVDFKSSKGIYPEYGYQVAAYANCIDGAMPAVLRLDKATGMPEWKEYTQAEYDKNLNVFMKLVELWYAIKEK